MFYLNDYNNYGKNFFFNWEQWRQRNIRTENMVVRLIGMTY